MTFFRREDFEKEQKYHTLLTCIDVLSKYAVAIPLENKDAQTIIDTMPEIIRRMGGKPKLIFSDDEGALRGELLKEYVENEGMELYRTRGKAQFVEKFNRTLKDMIFKRLEADDKRGKENLQWVDYLPGVLLTYNNKMVHSATGLTPSEARKERNELRAKVNIASKAKKRTLVSRVDCG